MLTLVACCILVSVSTVTPQATGTDTGGAAAAGGPGASDGNVNECPRALIDGAARLGSIVGRFGRKCYTIETATKMTWQHSAEACATYGGSLVHIENDQEQQFIAGFVQRHSGGSSVWIGLHDRIIEGTYFWANGGGLAYSHFDPNHSQPGMQDVEDCVVMKTDGFWDDIKCGYRDPLSGFTDKGEILPVMCQYDVLTLGIIG